MTSVDGAGHLRISIVTPAYNQARFLGATVESVLAQDYCDVEYLVIDDGSTDETRAVLGRYGERVKWISRNNRGQAATINEGWARATGDVLAWLNSDDTILPGALFRVATLFTAEPGVHLVFGDTVFTDAKGKPIRTSASEDFDYDRLVVECENPIPQPSAFIRRAVVEDVGLLNPQYRYFMDWEFWLRAGIRHRFAHVAAPLSTYRLHDSSNTVAQQARVAPELETVYQSYFRRPDVPVRIRSRRSRAWANMFFTSAGYFARGGRADLARRSALRALWVHPGLVLDSSLLHKLVFGLIGSTSAYGYLRRLTAPSTSVRAGPSSAL